MSRIVALVSTEPRDELARYLRSVGFEVRSYRAPAAAPRRGSLVWLPEPDRTVSSIGEAVRAWLGTSSTLRAVLISRSPTRLRSNLKSLHRRVHMLPSPIFGWQLVDSLRDPRFALT